MNKAILPSLRSDPGLAVGGSAIAAGWRRNGAAFAGRGHLDSIPGDLARGVSIRRFGAGRGIGRRELSWLFMAPSEVDWSILPASYSEFAV